MFKMISSSTNSTFKALRALVSSKKARKENELFLLESSRAVSTFIEFSLPQYQMERLLISAAWENDPLVERVQKFCPDVEILVLADFLFEKLCEARSSQGIIAVIHSKAFLFEERLGKGHYLLLDAIRDPGNLGTMIRSAVGAGFDGVLLYNDCVDPFNPKVVRSTMGALCCAHVWSVSLEQVQGMIAEGYCLCTTTGLGGANLYAANFPSRTILAIGSEANGLSETLMNMAAKKVTIPLDVRCESLNAAVAASICMFHMAAMR